MAASTDLFKQGTNNFSTTLSASCGSGDTTLSLTSVTNLPTTTGVVLVIDRVNSAGVLTPSLREYVKGVISGGTLATVSRGLGGSSALSHANGAVVEYVWDQVTQNDIVNGILEDHNQSGYHKELHDVNGNAWIDQGATSSAVNNLIVSNSATTNPVILAAEGSDTNINLQLKGKGTGAADLAIPYKFNVYLAGTVAQQDTMTTINLDTKIFDTGTNFSTSTHLFTAPIAGFYQFNAGFGIISDAGTGYNIQLLKNGSTVVANGSGLVAGYTNAFGIFCNVSTFVQLAASDTIAVQGIGANNTRDYFTGINETYFNGYLVSVT